METEPRHALEAGGRQPPAAQSAVQSPDPSSPPLRAAASVAAGASEVSASLRRSRLKQEPFAPLAGRLAPWAGVWPGLGGFRRFGLRPWRGTPAPMLGAAKATPKATRKVVPGDSETSRFRARENPRQIRAGRYGVPRARGGGGMSLHLGVEKQGLSLHHDIRAGRRGADSPDSKRKASDSAPRRAPARGVRCTRSLQCGFAARRLGAWHDRWVSRLKYIKRFGPKRFGPKRFQIETEQCISYTRAIRSEWSWRGTKAPWLGTAKATPKVTRRRLLRILKPPDFEPGKVPGNTRQSDARARGRKKQGLSLRHDIKAGSV